MNQLTKQTNNSKIMWPMPASKIRLETSTDTFHVWLWSFHDCFLLPTYFPPSLHLLEETLPSKQYGVFRQLWNWHLKTKFPKTNQNLITQTCCFMPFPSVRRKKNQGTMLVDGVLQLLELRLHLHWCIGTLVVE